MMMILIALMSASLQVANRAVWIDAETGTTEACELQDRRWSCPSRADASRGMLLVIATGHVEIAAASGNLSGGLESVRRLWCGGIGESPAFSGAKRSGRNRRRCTDPATV